VDAYPDLTDRIARLEARLELQELVARYCHCVDAGDAERLAELFTPDCSFLFPEGLVEGREAVLTFLTERLRRYDFTLHYPHSVVLDLVGPDDATGIVVQHGEHARDRTCSLGAFRYDDVYTRASGRWRFARRAISITYFLPWGEFVGGFTRGAAGGRPD
jgi:uncharacterized protein (TIGR02246 family)